MFPSINGIKSIKIWWTILPFIGFVRCDFDEMEEINNVFVLKGIIYLSFFFMNYLNFLKSDSPLNSYRVEPISFRISERLDLLTT